MAVTCPLDLDTLKLRQEIQSIYARVAADPSESFHFHRGPGYAAEWLGYELRPRQFAFPMKPTQRRRQERVVGHSAKSDGRSRTDAWTSRSQRA